MIVPRAPVGPLIGMLHAPPLPGSPQYRDDWDTVISHVLRDAEALASEGMPALMLENFGDTPFYPDRLPAITVTALTRLATEVRRRFDLPLGINALRNDGQSALAVAMAVGAAFIRVNVLTGARVTDQGLIQGRAHELVRDRYAWKAESIAILADVDVKHSAPLAVRPLEEETADLVHRGAADGVIVSGGRTGAPPDLEQLRAVRTAAAGVPVYLGSGVTCELLAETSSLADGWIVGTSLKEHGDVRRPVDRQRVRELMSVYAAGRR